MVVQYDARHLSNATAQAWDKMLIEVAMDWSKHQISRIYSTWASKYGFNAPFEKVLLFVCCLCLVCLALQKAPKTVTQLSTVCSRARARTLQLVRPRRRDPDVTV